MLTPGSFSNQPGLTGCTGLTTSVQMYRMNGRMAMSGDLLGALVSDLTPKSIEAIRFQEETELRVQTQQQLAALLKRRLNVALFFQDQNNLTTAPQNRCYTATSQKSRVTSARRVCHSKAFWWRRFLSHTIGWCILESWCCCRWCQSVC